MTFSIFVAQVVLAAFFPSTNLHYFAGANMGNEPKKNDRSMLIK